MPGAALSVVELFERLARGEAARLTVVTPNRRLARAARERFDALQAQKGLAAWEDADILPLDAFIERLYEDALHSELAGRVPPLLSEAQHAALWESVVAADHPGLLDPAAAAAQCAKAWRLAHAWRIEGAIGKFAGNDDTRAFAAWSRAYRERTAGETDRARLPDLVAGWLGERALRKPSLLVAFAFDLLAPQTGDFFRACERHGIEVRSCAPALAAAAAARASFASPRAELEAAARWARARLEAGARRIGVVVPDLGERRHQVARVFARALQPARHLPGARDEPPPFNLSLGAPLAEQPLVHAALAILRLAFREVPFAEVSRLLRSPFLGAAESERLSRERLDSALRRSAPARLRLAGLVAALGRGAGLRALLEKLLAAAQPLSGRSLSPRLWARNFTALLDAVGFPGERTLDSGEFQARAALFERLRELGALERVERSLSAIEALARLERLCAATFQPEAPPAPVQVLGILESAGLDFDCLWVSGMTEDAWPLAARPNPLVPVALQRKAGVPEAAAETSLALDRRITERWLRAAPEVVFSHAEKDEDRDLLPSPLIAAVPEGEVGVPDFPAYRDLVFCARRSVSFLDENAPSLSLRTVRGGTRVLADQSACPFRAFARWRLGAEGLQTPAEGPDAMARGRLIHDFLRRLWERLRSRAGLERDPRAEIAQAAREAVKKAGLEGRFAALERARLARLAAEWLQRERERGDFEVVALEKEKAIRIGGLALAGRIDRMDRLADGSHLLIDYKTGGRLSPQMWLGERPEEPQLPLYALSAAEPIGALAFAWVRPGQMKFMGFSRAKDQVPGLKPVRSWDGMLQSWRNALETLAQAFAAGEARVDPKDGLSTCRGCDLQPLCRVHERLAGLGAHREE